MREKYFSGWLTTLLALLYMLSWSPTRAQFGPLDSYNQVTTLANLSTGYYVLTGTSGAGATKAMTTGLTSSLGGSFVATDVQVTNSIITNVNTEIVWYVERSGNTVKISNPLGLPALSAVGNTAGVLNYTTFLTGTYFNLTASGTSFNLANAFQNFQYKTNGDFGMATTGQALRFYKFNSPLIPDLGVSHNSITSLDYVTLGGLEVPPSFTFYITTFNLVDNSAVSLTTGSSNLQISTNGLTWGSTISYNLQIGFAQPIMVRLKPGLSVGPYAETITATIGSVTKTINAEGVVVTPTVLPLNDFCFNAQNMVINGPWLSENMSLSTFSPPFVLGRDVWYKHTATYTGAHTFTMTGFYGDMDMNLYNGVCYESGMTSIIVAQTSSSTETITHNLTFGQTYLLRVFANDVNAQASSFVVRLTGQTVPYVTVPQSSYTASTNFGTPVTVTVPFTGANLTGAVLATIADANFTATMGTNSVDVTFNGNALGTQTANLVFTTPGGEPLSIPITVTSAHPNVNLSSPSNITSNSADYSYGPTTTATTYRLKTQPLNALMLPEGSPIYTTLPAVTASTAMTLSLAPATSYTYQIEALIDGVYTAVSSERSVTTPIAVPSISVPQLTYSATGNYGSPLSISVPVTVANLSNAVNATLGINTNFTVTPSSSTSSTDFVVTYNGTAAGLVTNTLTLSSIGALPVTVALNFNITNEVVSLGEAYAISAVGFAADYGPTSSITSYRLHVEQLDANGVPTGVFQWLPLANTLVELPTVVAALLPETNYRYSVEALVGLDYAKVSDYRYVTTTGVPLVVVPNLAPVVLGQADGSLSITVPVTGLNLTGDITASLSNNTNFTVSPTSLSASGNIEVTYTGSAGGIITNTLTLSTPGGLPVIVTMTFNAIGEVSLAEANTVSATGFMTSYNGTTDFTPYRLAIVQVDENQIPDMNYQYLPLINTNIELPIGVGALYPDTDYRYAVEALIDGNYTVVSPFRYVTTAGLPIVVVPNLAPTVLGLADGSLSITIPVTAMNLVGDITATLASSTNYTISPATLSGSGDIVVTYTGSDSGYRTNTLTLTTPDGVPVIITLGFNGVGEVSLGDAVAISPVGFTTHYSGTEAITSYRLATVQVNGALEPVGTPIYSVLANTGISTPEIVVGLLPNTNYRYVVEALIDGDYVFVSDFKYVQTTSVPLLELADTTFTATGVAGSGITITVPVVGSHLTGAINASLSNNTNFTLTPASLSGSGEFEITYTGTAAGIFTNVLTLSTDGGLSVSALLTYNSVGQAVLTPATLISSVGFTTTYDNTNSPTLYRLEVTAVDGSNQPTGTAMYFPLANTALPLVQAVGLLTPETNYRYSIQALVGVDEYALVSDFHYVTTAGIPVITVPNLAPTVIGLSDGSLSMTIPVTGLNLVGDITATLSSTSNFTISPTTLSATGDIVVTYTGSASDYLLNTLTLTTPDGIPVVLTLGFNAVGEVSLGDAYNATTVSFTANYSGTTAATSYRIKTVRVDEDLNQVGTPIYSAIANTATDLPEIVAGLLPGQNYRYVVEALIGIDYVEVSSAKYIETLGIPTLTVPQLSYSVAGTIGSALSITVPVVGVDLTSAITASLSNNTNFTIAPPSLSASGEFVITFDGSIAGLTNNILTLQTEGGAAVVINLTFNVANEVVALGEAYAISHLGFMADYGPTTGLTTYRMTVQRLDELGQAVGLPLYYPLANALVSTPAAIAGLLPNTSYSYAVEALSGLSYEQVSDMRFVTTLGETSVTVPQNSYSVTGVYGVPVTVPVPVSALFLQGPIDATISNTDGFISIPSTLLTSGVVTVTNSALAVGTSTTQLTLSTTGHADVVVDVNVFIPHPVVVLGAAVGLTSNSFHALYGPTLPGQTYELVVQPLDGSLNPSGSPIYVPLSGGIGVEGTYAQVTGLNGNTNYTYSILTQVDGQWTTVSSVMAVLTLPDFSPVFEVVDNVICEGSNALFRLTNLWPNITFKAMVNVNGNFVEVVFTSDALGVAEFSLAVEASGSIQIADFMRFDADLAAYLNLSIANPLSAMLTITPKVVYYRDVDGDGFGDDNDTVEACTPPAGYVVNAGDCDDSDVALNPNTVWYADADGDGFGDANDTFEACTPPAGYVVNAGDCDDSDVALNPNTVWYADADGDGFGNAASTATGCTAPAGYVSNNTDCDDANAAINPNTVWYADADGDGFGDASVSETGCTAPAGYVSNNTDCDDTNSGLNPNTIWYADADGDGYGNAAVSVQACTPPAGYVSNSFDCNDQNAAIHPGAVDVPGNGIDEDCDGQDAPALPAPIVTQLIDAHCGTTMSSMQSPIMSKPVANATAYRFKVIDVNSNEETVIEGVNRYFYFNQLTSTHYGHTYRVAVEVQVNGVWQGEYGQECFVSSPPLFQENVDPLTICGSTLEKITQVVHSVARLGATKYRFRVTHFDVELGENRVEVLERNYHWFQFNMLETAKYGTTYSIEVAVQYNNQAFSPYGPACYIQSPAVPGVVNCEQELVGKFQIIGEAKGQISSYRFEFMNLNTFEVVTVIAPRHWVTFVMIPNYEYGGEYRVRIAVMTNGNWSEYGDACRVLAPDAPAGGKGDIAVQPQFDVKAYPTQFEDTFRLKFEQLGPANVLVRMFDMTGREIDVRTLSAEDIEYADFGKNLPAGIYNVQIEQGDQRKVLRVIRK